MKRSTRPQGSRREYRVTCVTCGGSYAPGGDHERDHFARWCKPRVDPTAPTEPAPPANARTTYEGAPGDIVSSAIVFEGAAHDHVRVWNRGALAGELVVKSGDGRALGRRLVPGGSVGPEEPT